jgi:hypothetical protein
MRIHVNKVSICGTLLNVFSPYACVRAHGMSADTAARPGRLASGTH